MPVPDLEKTLQRYLEAVQPLVNPAQYAKVEELTKKFLDGEGPELQLKLLERQMKMKNWVGSKTIAMFFLLGFFKVFYSSNLRAFKLSLE